MSLLSTVLTCPICHQALDTQSKNCEFCKDFELHKLEKNNNFIDLTPKINIDKKPLRTEIFRSFWLSFFYEKVLPSIWAMGLRDFGGIEREIEEVLEYFGANLNIVVDLSCGTGIVARSLAIRQISPLVLAIDYSESMLKVLQQKMIQEKISSLKLVTIRGDVQTLPLKDNSIDAIYCGAAMHCWENPEQAVKNIYQALCPGGKLYLTTFLQPLPNIIFRFFSPQELKEIFSNGGFARDYLEVQSHGVYATVKCVKHK